MMCLKLVLSFLIARLATRARENASQLCPVLMRASRSGFGQLALNVALRRELRQREQQFLEERLFDISSMAFFAVQRTAGDVGRGHLLLGKLNLKSIDFIATRDGVGGTSETLVTPAENAGCSTGSRTELWFVRSGTRVEGLR